MADDESPVNPGPSSSNAVAEPSNPAPAVASAPRYLNDAFEQLRTSFFTRVTQTQGLTRTVLSYQTGTRVFIQRAPSEAPTPLVVSTHVARILELLFLTSAQVTHYAEAQANTLFQHIVHITRWINFALRKSSSGMTDSNKQMIRAFNQEIIPVMNNTINKLKEIAKARLAQRFIRYHYCALSDSTGQYIYADIRRGNFIILAAGVDGSEGLRNFPEVQMSNYINLLDYLVNSSVMLLAGMAEPTFINAMIYVGVDINKVQTLVVKTEFDGDNHDNEREELTRGSLIKAQQFIAADAAPKVLPAAYQFTALSMAILFSNMEGVEHLLAAGADPNKPAGLFSPLFALAKRSGPLHRLVPLEERGSLAYVHNSHKVTLFDALCRAGLRGEEEILTRAASERCKAEPQQPETSATQTNADERQAEALAWVREHEYEAMKAYVTRATKQGTSVKAFTLMGTSTNLYSGHDAEQPGSQTSVPSTTECRLL